VFHLSLDFLWLVFLRLAVASPSPAPALQRRFRGECRVSVPPPGVGAPVPTAPGLAKLRFMGRPLWKTAHKRRPSPSIRSALVQWVCPPLVFGSSMISEHEVSSPRPRPTQRYCGSTERNGPPPPLNRLFSSPLSCRVRMSHISFGYGRSGCGLRPDCLGSEDSCETKPKGGSR